MSSRSVLLVRRDVLVGAVGLMVSVLLGSVVPSWSSEGFLVMLASWVMRLCAVSCLMRLRVAVSGESRRDLIIRWVSSLCSKSPTLARPSILGSVSGWLVLRFIAELVYDCFRGLFGSGADGLLLRAAQSMPKAGGLPFPGSLGRKMRAGLAFRPRTRTGDFGPEADGPIDGLPRVEDEKLLPALLLAETCPRATVNAAGDRIIRGEDFPGLPGFDLTGECGCECERGAKAPLLRLGEEGLMARILARDRHVLDPSMGNGFSGVIRGPGGV
jgi:hypothetical protein